MSGSGLAAFGIGGCFNFYVLKQPIRPFPVLPDGLHEALQLCIATAQPVTGLSASSLRVHRAYDDL